MKQILISRINPCCLLSYADMVFWIDNLSGISEATRNLIKDNLMMNGQLKTEGWQILSGAVQFEPGTPITAQNIYDWATYQPTLTCNQLKVVIEYTKLDGNFIPVEYPPLELVELDLKTHPIPAGADDYEHFKHISFVGDNGSYSIKALVKQPTFYIKNFDYIKEANPYLIIERWKPSSKYGKKMGWRRAPSMRVGDKYHDGWNNQDVNISSFDMHRPNEIPLTSAKQQIDIFAENYIQNSRGKKNIPTFVGETRKKNKNVGIGKNRERVRIRFRIGIRVKGKEFTSRPLLETTILARNYPTEHPTVFRMIVGFGKI